MPKYIIDTDAKTCLPYTETPSPVVIPPAPLVRGKLGWNAPKNEDWQPRTFNNMMLSSRKWINIAAPGWPTMATVELNLDFRGYPQAITPGARPATIMTWDAGARSWPDGQYSIVALGNGAQSFKLRTQSGVEPPRSGSNFTYTPSTQGGLMVELVSSGLSSLGIYPAGSDLEIANPFIAASRGTACVRWMDAQKINNSPAGGSLSPSLVRSFAADQCGISPEMIAEASIDLDCDAWVCMPHLATNSYVTTFARELAAHMPVNRKVYVEFSNELWNGIFSQGRSFGATYQQSSPLYNKRATEVINLFKQTYGANCVRVIASQSANTGTATNALAVARVNGGCDALAIAPYFGHNIHTDADATPANINAAVDKAIDEMQANATIAAANGIQLLGYEGGQHMIGVSEAVAYGDSMAAAYTRYLAAWKAISNTGVMCLYNIAESGGAGGYWGSYNRWGNATPRSLATTAAFL